MSYQESIESPLVCLDRYCPKVFDPHRNLVMCRCYQAQSVSPSTSHPLPASVSCTGNQTSSPPLYPGSLQYGDSQTVPQSSLNYPSYLGHASGYDGYGMYQNIYPQLSPNMTNSDWSMYSAPQATPYAQSAQMDQILRSQVSDFWNYQQLSHQVNGSDIPATKQSTKLLKTWLREHRKNPYPTKTEKVMLAFAARMTMTQISNWFANARRRMKQQKEKGNSSDCVLSDISDDDDKDSVCKSPTPMATLKMSTQAPIKDLYLSKQHPNISDYLQDGEKMKIQQPLMKDEFESKPTVESTVTKLHTDSNTHTDKNDKLSPKPARKSKIWSVTSMLS